MQDLIIVTNRPKFQNRMLEKATLTLMNCNNDIKSRQFSIASVLAQVEVEGLYKDDGFASCAEYAEKTFGIKKSTAYALITIGKEYTRPILNEKGKVTGHCSNLLPPADMEKQDAPLIDFTTRQISLFSTLGREQVIDLVSNGSLSPTMTANQIREVVKVQKALNAPEQPEQSTEVFNAPEQPEQSTAPEQPEQSTEVPNAPEQPEQSTAPEQSEQSTEPVHLGINRPDTFDDLPSTILIAELRKRGFKVFRDDVEQVYNW